SRIAICLLDFSLLIPRPPISTLFPYTTLFRSDFYDRDVMSDGRLMIVLGDVTGHGIGPALLAAACRAYARSSFAVHTDLFERQRDRKSTRLNSSHVAISYAVFCLKKKIDRN